MKLKDGLILREVAGQYVIVPTGKRVGEIPGVFYMNGSGALLWREMKDRDVTEEGLAACLIEHFPTLGKEQARKDAKAFADLLRQKNLLEQGSRAGVAHIRVPMEDNRQIADWDAIRGKREV